MPANPDRPRLLGSSFPCWWSRIRSTPGTQSAPPSVRTSFRFGYRSNTPAKMSIHSARCEKNPASTKNIHPVAGNGAVRGTRVGGVVVDRQLQLRAGRPDRLVHRVDERRESAVGRDPGQEDAAEQVGLARPADLRDGGVDVVQEDLGHAGPATRCVGAELGQPPVVGLESFPPKLVLTRPRRLAR